jgi:DNA helicase IV
MLAAMEELNKFRIEMTSFRTWMEKAYKILEDKERQLANLNKLQGNADGIKEFVSDVMTHGADLKFLTISGQKFIDLSKVKNVLFCFKGHSRNGMLCQPSQEN